MLMRDVVLNGDKMGFQGSGGDWSGCGIVPQHGRNAAA